MGFTIHKTECLCYKLRKISSFLTLTKRGGKLYKIFTFAVPLYWLIFAIPTMCFCLFKIIDQKCDAYMKAKLIILFIALTLLGFWLTDFYPTRITEHPRINNFL